MCVLAPVLGVSWMKGRYKQRTTRAPSRLFSMCSETIDISLVQLFFMNFY